MLREKKNYRNGIGHFAWEKCMHGIWFSVKENWFIHSRIDARLVTKYKICRSRLPFILIMKNTDAVHRVVCPCVQRDALFVLSLNIPTASRRHQSDPWHWCTMSFVMDGTWNGLARDFASQTFKKIFSFILAVL